MPPNYVDLTLDDEEEEEVVVVAANPIVGRERAGAWQYGASGQSQPASSLQTFSPRRTNSPVIKQSPGSRVATRPATASAQGTPQSTPSKSARFSIAALNDLQPPALDLQPRTLGVPPPPLPTRNPRNSTPQPPPRPSKEHHTPRMQTPNGIEWTVDQIAGKLGALVGQVHQGHGRLVEFMLEEAERRVPQARHLSTFDDFADMKSIVLEPPINPDVETMVVKFKASPSPISAQGSII
jgi:hypothetical protein